MTAGVTDEPRAVGSTRRRWRVFGPLPPVLAGLRLALGVAVLAVALSFLIPNRYTASGEFYLDTRQLELGGGGAGDLASIASEVGLTAPLGASISPYLVVELATSDTVLVAIARTPLPPAAFRQMKPVPTLEQHYDIDQNTADKRFWYTIRELRDRVSTDVGNRSGLITISVWDSDPGLAAWLTALEIQWVQHYLGIARASRARAERTFVEGRERALHDSLRAADSSLAAFLSANRTTDQSPLLQMRESQLRRNVDVVTALYSSVQRDLERARADEVRDTPVMTITATPHPPVKKSWPKRSIIAAIAFILALGVHLTRGQWLPTVRALGIALEAPRPE